MSDHSSLPSLLHYYQPGSERLTAVEEAEAIHKLYIQTIEENDVWSLIDYRWWSQWMNYAGFDDRRNMIRESTSTDRPGPIDNNALAHPTDDGALKRDLMEGEDYVFIHKSVADLLYGWYGGGPLFERKVITQGAKKRTKIDLFPYFITLIPCNDTGSPDENNISIIPIGGKITMGSFIKILENHYRNNNKEGNNNNNNNNNSNGEGEEGKEQKEGEDDTVRIWIEETDEEKQKKKEIKENAKKDAMDTESTSSSSNDNNNNNNNNNNDSSPITPSSPPPSSDPIPLDDDWKLIRGDDLKQPIEQFNFSHRTKLLIDRKNLLTGQWQRYFKERHWREFQIGDKIDACDRVKHWYGAVVRHVDKKNNRIQVKFNGWSTNFDEWIEMDSDRLAPEGTKVDSSSSSSSISSIRSTYSSGSYYSSWNSSDEGRPSISGAVGLRNLGNTCFMNSIIQCLSHTPILNEFFVDDEYLSQINRDNPLGWQGKIAEEWGSLMKEIWSDHYTSVAPRKLKDAIAEFQPRFSGYQQHDSSELLSFLLDGLHEDLNRIKKKPFTNAVESNNRPDHIVAEEAWQVFQLRNKSIIVDNIYGQYKSRVVCPKHECGRISITFDPFHMISVPLPQQMDTIQKVHLVYADRSKPVTQYGCVVSKVGPMNELKESLSKLSGVNPKRMIVVELWQGKVYRFFDEDSSVGDIRPNDHIYIYEVPSAELYKPGEYIPIQIINVRAEKNKYYDPQWDTSKAYELSLIGIPSIIVLPIKQSLTSKAIRALIRAQIDRTIKDTPLPPPRPDNNNNNNDDPAMNTDNNNNPSSPPPSTNDNNNNADNNTDSSPSKPATTNAEYDRRNPPRPDDIPDPSGFPFRILQLETDGRSCYQCPYTKNCIGCELPNTDDLYEIRISQRYSYIDSGKEAKIIFAILWKGDGGLYDHDNNVKNIINDTSCLESSDNLTKLDEVSLFDCIKLFTKEETLSEQDPWYCSNCKEFRQATKKFDLWRLPNILIIHLKRFAYTKTYREKISTLVRYPIEGLDLSDFCVNDDIQGKKAIYDLYAVSNHMGGMGGGHYIAHIKNLMNGEWYCHDDSHVSSCNNNNRENDIINSSAYVLFYVRRDVLTPWKGKPIIRRPSSLGGGGNNNNNNNNDSDNNNDNNNNNTEGDKKINGKEEKGIERREGEKEGEKEGDGGDAVSIAGPVQNKGIDHKELIMEHRSIQHGLREADEREIIDRANTSLDDVE